MSSNKIVLTSSDGKTFMVEEAVARQLQVVAHMMEHDLADKAIPLQNVTGDVLAKVIEYCETQVDGAAEADDEEAKKKPVAADSTDAEVEEANKLADSTATEDEEAKKKSVVWDAEFMKKFDIDMIFNLIMAANYLNVKGLLELTCQTVADHIKDMSVEEVREIFNIKNDFTPEEEAALRNENEWAFTNDPKP